MVMRCFLNSEVEDCRQIDQKDKLHPSSGESRMFVKYDLSNIKKLEGIDVSWINLQKIHKTCTQKL